MIRLTKSLKEHCDKTFRENEILIVPNNKDVGLENYLNLKAQYYHKEKKFRKDFSACHLFLSYPEPNLPPIEYQSFFDLPTLFSIDRNFQGLLAIDITPYKTYINCSELNLLLAFLKDNNTAFCYILIIKSEIPGDAKHLANKISDKLSLSIYNAKLPTIEELIKDAKQQFANLNSSLHSHLKNGNYGFEEIDRIIPILKCDGNIECNSDIKPKQRASQKRFGY